MLSNYIFLIGLIICFVNSVNSNGYYTIVGSKQIRPNSEYTASVTLHAYVGSSTIRLSIENGNNYKKTKDVTVQGGRTQLVKIATGSIVAGSSGYKLVAEGISGINFRKETSLNLNEKSFSVFIQTDKGMYKSKDLVQFRVLILDENTKPVQLHGDLDVFITDGNKNLIKQWEKITPTKGVFSNNLQLSEYPVLGNWIIKVKYLGEVKEKSFEVAEYILPTFEVVIDTPKHQLYSDNIIRATISGKYIFGQPVRGEAVVTMNEIGSGRPPLFQRTLKIEKKETIELRIADLKLSSTDVQRNFEISATLTEELTEHSQTGSTIVKLHVDKYKIVNVNPSREFKPDLPFEIIVKVTKHDETPVTDDVNELKIIYGPSHARRTDNEDPPYTIENGIVTSQLIISDGSSDVYVYAVYLGKEYFLGHLTKAKSGTGAYLQAAVTSGTPEIGRKILIEVKSTERMSSITYQVFGRGNVLDSDTVIVRNRDEHRLTITATAAMVPKAQIVIFYLKDGDIISTKLELESDDNLANEMEVSTPKARVKPGDSVEIVVSTEPDSFIGLLGIDQSAIILKSGFDFSRQSIFDDLDEYNKDYTRGGSPSPSLSSISSPSDIFKDFTSSGAVIISNAEEYKQLQKSISSSPPRFSNKGGGGGGGGGGGSGGYGFTSVPMSSVTFYRPVDRTEQADMSPIVQNGVIIDDPRIPRIAFEVPTELHEFDLSQVVVRKLFPESWIWDDITDSVEGTRILNKTIPDTMTSWIITGFSVNPIIGLGMTKEPTKLQVFQPFFVSLDLPFSIKRGETVAIKVVVFNYLSSSVNAEVTLRNDNKQFQFAELSGVASDSLFRTKTISIKAEDGTALSFLIRPFNVGPLTIKVSAHTSNAGDIIERILPVEPEGDSKYQNQAQFIDLRSRTNYEFTFSILIPPNAVPDSTRLELTVTGDIMGTTLTNLENLIRMPYGCGEQNMLNFVPNIVVIDYLTSTGQLTSATELKIIGFLESGYQRQLNYAHSDGSFSAFGKSDSSGNTWLTAYVICAFNRAQKYIKIDTAVINKAVTWLISLQTSNGNFPEVGRILNKSMQGGSGQGVALAAYVTISILEIVQNQSQYKSSIDKAISYLLIAAESNNIQVYDLALISYALQLAKHSSSYTVFRKFQLRAQQVGDKKWWGTASSSSNANLKANSKDVETTSYGLLATLSAGVATDVLSIVRWLLSKRSDRGGFESTQDTVMGITALAEYSKITTSRGSNVQISIKYDGKESRSTVTATNALVLQQYPLPNSVRKVTITATGTGFAVVDLSHRYNVNTNEPKPGFNLTPSVVGTSTVDHLLLSVCGSYVSKNGQSDSNMAVMEVELPTGYKADIDHFSVIHRTKNAKRVETKNRDTIVVIYFDNFGSEQICPTISAFRSHKVADIKPVPVKLYDYYDNDITSCTFYQVQQQNLCSICEGVDCGTRC